MRRIAEWPRWAKILLGIAAALLGLLLFVAFVVFAALGPLLLPRPDDRASLEQLQREPIIAEVTTIADDRGFSPSGEVNKAPNCDLKGATHASEVSRTWLLPSGSDEAALVDELTKLAEADGWGHQPRDTGNRVAIDAHYWAGQKSEEHYEVRFLIQDRVLRTERTEPGRELTMTLEDKGFHLRENC